MVFVLLVTAALPALADPREPWVLGDFPIEKRAARPFDMVRGPQMVRTRFGNLPIRFDFNDELLASVSECAVFVDDTPHAVGFEDGPPTAP